MGFNGKILNIWKKADRRAKRMKIWDSGILTLLTWGVSSFQFSLGSLGALWEISDDKVSKGEHRTVPTVFIQTLWKDGDRENRVCYFLSSC